jgi:hypothetical protein
MEIDVLELGRSELRYVGNSMEENLAKQTKYLVGRVGMFKIASRDARVHSKAWQFDTPSAVTQRRSAMIRHPSIVLQLSTMS